MIVVDLFLLVIIVIQGVRIDRLRHYGRHTAPCGRYARHTPEPVRLRVLRSPFDQDGPGAA